MMTGKEKCTLLKSIRCHIAQKNGIDYRPTHCTFQGECKGTCPKCEAELQYLTNELEKIKQSGKRVAIAGIAAAMMATSASGCARKEEPDPFIEPPADSTTENSYEDMGKIIEATDGEVAVPDDFTTQPDLTPDPEYTEELTGDIAIDYVPFTFEYFMKLNRDEQQMQLEVYLRYELQEQWDEYLTEKNETADVYVYGEKTLAITYHDDGTLKDFILSWDEEETP